MSLNYDCLRTYIVHLLEETDTNSFKHANLFPFDESKCNQIAVARVINIKPEYQRKSESILRQSLVDEDDVWVLHVGLPHLTARVEEKLESSIVLVIIILQEVILILLQ
jgi:hypothetical protein